jgi:crotonobetainyl-CoA:carnitine CoA-transferase CaiB-like acyl-CoA transferase
MKNMEVDPQPPLGGLRVLDASRVLAGPLCGQILGDLGAEVIKLERPGSGDDTRSWGPPFVGQFSAYFLSCNRNKRGITLDLARPQGVEIFHQLVRHSDVLLENFRAASADKLGLGPDKLLAVNPQLIVCSISGFGRTGPLAEQPGYDYAAQGMSGLMDITGPVEGPPCKVGVAVADVLTGLNAAIAVLACLHARGQSGHGYAIDLALLDCALAAQVNMVQAYLSTGSVPPRQGNAHFQIVPYQLFATADGWLALCVGNDGQWQKFSKAVGRADLGADPRFTSNNLRVENRGLLVPQLEELLRGRPTREWEELLEKAQVPCAPVWDYARLFAEPQLGVRGMKVTVRDPQGRPVDLVGSPFHIEGAKLAAMTHPPALGQHTDEVLEQLLGLDLAARTQLREQGII